MICLAGGHALSGSLGRAILVAQQAWVGRARATCLPQLNPNGPELSILGALPLAAGQRNRPSDAPLPPNNGAAGKALNLGKAAFLRRRSQCSLVWRASDIIPLLRALPTSTHLALPFLDLPPPLRTAAKSKPRGQIFASVPPPPIPSPLSCRVVSPPIEAAAAVVDTRENPSRLSCLVCSSVISSPSAGSPPLPAHLCGISRSVSHILTYTHTIASRRFESKLPAVAAPETRVATTPLN